MACGWSACICPSKFVEKTFANGPKSAKFTKVFFLESFPVYGTIPPCDHEAFLIALEVKIALDVNGIYEACFVNDINGETVYIVIKS